MLPPQATPQAMQILEQYYLPSTMAHNILRQHSESVANKAVAIAKALNLRQEQQIDINFIQDAALLHDIGIYATDTPVLGCYGDQPYLRHGIIGHNLLLAAGFPRHAAVCKNHIGVGLTATEIMQQKLPLPHLDFLPQSIEEQIITYADLFFSKNPTQLGHERCAVKVRQKVVSFGTDKGVIFDHWHNMFCNNIRLKETTNNTSI